MELFNRLPGSLSSPPGLERAVLRRLPATFAGGTLVLSLALLTARLLGATEMQDALSSAEILLIGTMLLYWNALLLAAIAAFIVMVMKGPAYVADAYPLPDRDDDWRAEKQKSRVSGFE